MSEVPMTESHCSFSTGIDGSITAGRGRLDGNGYWEFPCEDCARRANYNLNERRMRDAELSRLRAQLATARADLATAEQEKARLEQTIGTYVTAYKAMTRQRDQAEQEKAGLEAEVKHWQTCSNCGETMDAPGHCSKATLEATEGWMAEVEKERQAREALQARIEKAVTFLNERCEPKGSIGAAMLRFLTDAPDGGQR